MYLSIPIPVPTSGEIRMARARFAKVLSLGLRGVRTPVLAGVGTADLVVVTLGALRDRASQRLATLAAG